MTNVYFSIVSHHNDKLIEENFFNIPRIIGNYKISISVIDNVNSDALKKCQLNGINYYADNVIRGYGANNNKNFEILKPEESAIFIVCNPDITIQIDQLENILKDFQQRNADIYGVKVYESKDLLKHSSHNRAYPGLLDPLISLIFKKKLFSRNADQFANPDWIGGAFMIFNASSYLMLKGFDKRYFMYYEDTDICHRANSDFNMNIIYNPKFYIVHEAKRAGRKLFSIHFLWNLKSMFTYFLRFPPKKIISLK